MADTGKRPTTHQANLAKLPRAVVPLIERPQWCIWRWTQLPTGKWQKPPFMATQPNRHANVKDPGTWTNYATALAAVQADHGDGISYILTEADRYAAIDLDNCRDVDTHSIDVWAQNFLEAGRNSYSEVTPSGTGCRIWGLADGATLNKKFSLNIDGKDIAAELFRRTNKALTITGYKLDTIRALANIDKVIDWAIVWGERCKAAAAPAAMIRNGFSGNGRGHSVEEIEQIVRVGASNGANRSNLFRTIVGHYLGCGWDVEQICAHLQQFPDGIGARYISEERLMKEVRRSAGKYGVAVAAVVLPAVLPKPEDDPELQDDPELHDDPVPQPKQPTQPAEPDYDPELDDDDLEDADPDDADPEQPVEPKPLPDALAPVLPFDLNVLPAALAPWVGDIADRLQCPPDYVAISAITALGSLIGRRVGIKPQATTDWIEYANLWGCFIGSPGMMKSPAMQAALAPLHYLEAEAAEDNEVAREAFKANMNAFKLRQKVRAQLEAAALKKGKTAEITNADLLGCEPEEPKEIRYRTNDSSYEALGELLINNPAGLLLERDELVSLLRHLDREEQTVARGFYMSGWDGKQPYTFDRITRGHLHIEAVCISILGNTQPARISEYVRRANLGGAGGDGLIQRFSLMVWPDTSPAWRNVDEYLNTNVREHAWNVFVRMSQLTETNLCVGTMGARRSQYDKTPYYRFDNAALEEFVHWREVLERRVRDHGLSPAIEGHFAKYRKLVPALALINHLADGGEGSIGHAALHKAIAFSVYLESHARRIYSATDLIEVAAAKAILARIREGELMDGFSARDVHQRGWSSLTEHAWVEAGLNLLVELNYLAAKTAEIGQRGGRPKVIFTINPAALK
jgi:Protein of unknown function (DUF3987)